MDACQQIQDVLSARGETLCTAESCTGGRIAAALTAVPGASLCFQGSVVAYQNTVKTRLLNVSADTICQHGVVSREVVVEMVKGACALMQSDYAIATSGCAGPGGGTDACPVGTIWIACGKAGHIVAKCLHGDRGRSWNVENATYEALQLLVDFLHILLQNTLE